MTEQQLLEQIILNLGDKAPYLLVVFMVLRYVWPDVRVLGMAWIEARQHVNERPDPIAASVSGLSARIDAMMGAVTAVAAVLNSSVEENRRASAEMSHMVNVVIGLVGEVARGHLASLVTTVSPDEQAEGSERSAALVGR